jgi:RNA polymerase sigma-70 factor (ECF subfamily)
VRAHHGHAQFRGETEQQLKAWLRRILANTLSNALRSIGRRGGGAELSLDDALEQSSTGIGESVADPGMIPQEIAAQNEDLLRLANALAELPEDQRTVLELKHLHGYSIAAICESTGRSPSSVVGLMYRGMKSLRTRLKAPTSEQPDDVS